MASISVAKIYLNAVFHEDTINNTFGKMKAIGKSTVYKPAADFRFDIMYKVICCNTKHTGYVLRIHPEKIGEESVEPM